MNRHDKETYKLIFDKLIGNDVMLAIDEDIYSEVVENLTLLLKWELWRLIYDYSNRNDASLYYALWFQDP